MVKFLIISNSGEFLPIALRMRQEGAQLNAYVHNTQFRRNYAGIIEKTRITGLKKALRRADTVIFDMTRTNEKTKYDRALLKLFGIKKDSPSVFGPVADKLKRTHKVIGGGEFTETIEFDRVKGMKLAEKVGFAIPEYHTFKTLKKGAKFLENSKKKWVFKPLNNMDLDLTFVESFPGQLKTKLTEEYRQRIGEKIDYLLQKKIEGVELSTEVWIDGQGSPALYNHTLESKRMMNANLGVHIGSQSNTVWVKEGGFLTDKMNRLAGFVGSKGYVGPVDVNTIVSDGVPYFLEFTPRLGFDALYCLLTLLRGRITDFFSNDFNSRFDRQFAASERLTIPPFPYTSASLLRNFAQDVDIDEQIEKNPHFFAEDVYQNSDNRYKCSGSDGLIGVMTGKSDSIGGAWGNVYRALKKIRVCADKQYRVDSAKKHEIRFNKLKNWKLL